MSKEHTTMYCDMCESQRFWIADFIPKLTFLFFQLISRLLENSFCNYVLLNERTDTDPVKFQHATAPELNTQIKKKVLNNSHNFIGIFNRHEASLFFYLYLLSGIYYSSIHEYQQIHINPLIATYGLDCTLHFVFLYWKNSKLLK